MKRLLIFLIVAFMASACSGGTFPADKFTNVGYLWGLGVNDPGLKWARRIDSQVSGSHGNGKIWYVDTNVSNEGDGTSAVNAFDTLNEAIDASLADSGANRGDVIYILQNSTESLTGANAVDVDVAGIKVIGLGVGSNRPEFTSDNASAEFVIGAASVWIENITFSPGVDSVIHCIDIENAGDWATIWNCEFYDQNGANTDEWDDVIQVGTTATDVMIANCKMTYTSSSVDTNTFIDLSAATISRPRVIGNYIFGGFDDAPIWGAAAVPTECIINYNVVHNTETGDLGIEFSGNATGTCYGNLVFTDAAGTSYDTGVMEGGGGLWGDTDSSDTTPIPWVRPETGVNQLNVTTITAINAGLTGFGFRGTCDSNSAGATNFMSADLSGFVDDYFNSGWTATVLLDDSGAGSAPEFEERDIINYGTSGAFIVSPAFTIQVTTDDEVYIRRYEDSDLTRKATLFGGSGNIFYVDSGQAGTPSTAETGKTWDGSFTTIALAIAGASASNGDIIYVAAGHSETLSGAIAINVAGVSIIGLGEGSLQPTIDCAIVAAQWDVSVANVHIENIKFVSTKDSVLRAIDLAAGADGTHIKNCTFVDGNSTDEFLEIIVLASGTDDVIIEGCQFLAQGTSGTEAIIVEAGVCDNLQIIDNFFLGDWSIAAIWSNQANTNCLIKDNVIHNITTGQHCIELTASATGDIVGNALYGDTEGSILDSGSMIPFGNSFGVVIDVEALPGWVIDQDLDHFIETAVADTSDLVDMVEVGDDTILANLLTSDGDTSGYDRRTDSLEALADASYWRETTVKKVATAADDDLFDVDGGRILITSFTGLVSTEIGGGTNTLKIIFDADGVPDIDSEFTTAVDIDGDTVGTRFTFSAVAQSILIPVSNTVGNSNLMAPWFCGEGVIEQDSQGSPAGEIIWYMTYKPLDTGVTVSVL